MRVEGDDISKYLEEVGEENTNLVFFNILNWTLAQEDKMPRRLCLSYPGLLTGTSFMKQT